MRHDYWVDDELVIDACNCATDDGQTVDDHLPAQPLDFSRNRLDLTGARIVESPPAHVRQVPATVPTASDNDDAAKTDALLPQVYEELRRLAKQRLSREGPGLTLQPTALVHEAYLRVLGEAQVQWNSRGHFFAAAAQAMRRILIERARRVQSVKHGGEHSRLALDALDAADGPSDFTIAPDDQREQLVLLDGALQRLEQRDPRKAQVVMLRFFAGLSIEQTAAALDLSPATVKNEWRFARAWLHSEMEHVRPP
jgi:RNA polymerase sigma factor (TIGR02999 family)